jgi:tetratricopeptide (TPR) repeat protein
MVGLTNVTIEYSRPSMKGRPIYGGLVPFDKLWRTGANKNTIFTFSTDVKIMGQDLAAGSYAMFTRPGEIQWEVVFYKDTNNWGLPEDIEESKIALRAKVTPNRLPVSVETFNITIGELRNGSALIELMWETTIVAMRLEVPTSSIMDESISKVLSGPSADDYYTAARYYLEEGRELGTALDWMNKSIELGGERFWRLRQKALILAEMGAYKDAIASAKRSIELAKEVGNMNYVRNNEESIRQWSRM